MPAERNALLTKESELDLVVEVQEGKAGAVSFGPGWSLNKGWNYGAEASYSNIGGVGRQASVRGQISEEKDQKAIGRKTLVGRKIGAGYLEPFILDTPVDATVSANQKAEWGGELWELSYGGEIGFQYKLRQLLPNSHVSTFYGQKVAKTEGSSEREDDLVASDVRIGSVGVRFGMDRRDNIKFPTAGYTFDTELAWARYGLGGDIRYFRWDVGTAWYAGLMDRLVLALGVNLTSYDGIQRKGDRIGILPPSERLFSGGVDTVRGFPPRSLGPEVRSPKGDKGTAVVDGAAVDVCNISYELTPLDGNRRTTIKTELRYKLTEDIATNFFVDNGNVFLSKEQLKKFERAYDKPGALADLPPDHPCSRNPPQVERTVQDNIGYDYAELLTNPGYIWSRHYYSYGLSLSWLTPLGSVNIGYGLPWREPKTEACNADSTLCHTRGKDGGHWLTRGEIHLNVGTRF